LYSDGAGCWAESGAERTAAARPAARSVLIFICDSSEGKGDARRYADDDAPGCTGSSDAASAT
jgi:hypothetical protein